MANTPLVSPETKAVQHIHTSYMGVVQLESCNKGQQRS